MKQALTQVSLEVGQGEILGLVGPNGAGKTTLVKILAGIVHPTGGSATVLGYTPWERADAFRRQIALIMGQKAQLWWDLPAADGFLLLKEIYGIPTERYERNLAELCEMLGVRDELKVQVRRLSLGERMKMEVTVHPCWERQRSGPRFHCGIRARSDAIGAPGGERRAHEEAAVYLYP